MSQYPSTDSRNYRSIAPADRRPSVQILEQEVAGCLVAISYNVEEDENGKYTMEGVPICFCHGPIARDLVSNFYQARYNYLNYTKHRDVSIDRYLEAYEVILLQSMVGSWMNLSAIFDAGHIAYGETLRRQYLADMAAEYNNRQAASSN